MFSPTPIPEPAYPPPPPSPPPPTPETIPRVAGREASTASLNAFRDYHELCLIDHACRLLAVHGISERGPFPFVCMACQKPWPCPEVTWAADWTLAAKQHGLLEELGIVVGDDILAIVASRGTNRGRQHPEAGALVGAGRGDG